MAIYQSIAPERLSQLCGRLLQNCPDPKDAKQLALALCTELPALDFAQAEAACHSILQGVQHGRQLLQRPAFKQAQDMEQLLPQLTRQMSAAERKGFYLILYEAYRQSDAELCPAAAAAPPDHTLVPRCDEDELCRLAARQLELHAPDLVSGGEGAEALAAVPPQVLAAAMYAAHKKGALDTPLAQDAALLGFACGAAAEVREMEQEEAERMVHLLLAALAAVAVIYMVNPAAGELTAGLLQMLENGTLHTAVKMLVGPVAASLEHLLPAAAGTVTFVEIQKGLDVFYKDVAAQSPASITPWSTALQLPQDGPLWQDTKL